MAGGEFRLGIASIYIAAAPHSPGSRYKPHFYEYMATFWTRSREFASRLNALPKIKDGSSAYTAGARATYWISFGVATLGVICIGTGLLLIRTVSRPVVAMTKAMYALAEHDLTHSIPGVGR